MGILNDVLQWKQYKDAKESQAYNAIPQAVQAFITGRQQAMENQNSALKTQIDAAKAGYRIEGNKLVVDPEYSKNVMSNIIGVNTLTGETSVLGQVKGKSDVVRNVLPEEDVNKKASAYREAVTENPSVDQDTQKAIAANEFILPRLQRVQDAIDSGAFSDNDFAKLAQQITVSKSGDLIVPDGHPLEDMIGAINDIKLTGFALGGANYTGTEAEKIEGRLSPVGKSLTRWKKDLSSLPEFFNSKAKAGLMGLKEARAKTEERSSEPEKILNGKLGSTKSGNKFKKIG